MSARTTETNAAWNHLRSLSDENNETESEKKTENASEKKKNEEDVKTNGESTAEADITVDDMVGKVPERVIEALKKEKKDLLENKNDQTKQLQEQALTIENLEKEKKDLINNARSSDDAKKYDMLKAEYDALQKKYTIMNNSSELTKALNKVKKENEELKSELRTKEILNDTTEGSASAQAAVPQTMPKPVKPEKPQNVSDDFSQMEQWRNDMKQYKKDMAAWKKADMKSTLKHGIKSATNDFHVDSTISCLSVINMILCIIGLSLAVNKGLLILHLKDALNTVRGFGARVFSAWEIVAHGMNLLHIGTEPAQGTIAKFITALTFLIIAIFLFSFIKGKDIRLMDRKHALIWIVTCGSMLILSIGLQTLMPTFNSMIIWIISIPVLFILIEYIYNKYH